MFFTLLTHPLVLMLCGVLAAYLLGSIPSAVWLGKTFYGIDVRKQGSGNAGATNVIRVLGLKPGLVVLLLDALKGWMAVASWHIFAPDFFTPNMLINYKLVLAGIAVVGHIFPVFAGFKGGKGVATLVGVILALFPGVFLILISIFAFILLVTGYVSLASMIAAISFPFLAYFSSNYDYTALIIFAIMIAVFVPVTHKKNIFRLIKGTENKFRIKRKDEE